MDEEWPLLGRSAEAALVGEAITTSRGMVVAGAAGVGKTRLIRDVVAGLDPSTFAIEPLAATRALAAIPLGAFSHLDEGRAGAFLTPVGAIRHALLEHAAPRRLLLVIDDAHALDGASAAVVHQLAVTGDATVIATIRSGEPAPEPVTALWKDGLCGRLDLQPLSPRETAALLGQVLGGSVDARTASELWESTQGNLLFLRELVADGLHRGALQLDAGRWRWAGRLHAPARVAELIATQLRELDPDRLVVLELVALGEPLEWELLRAFVRGADAAVADGLVAIERRDRRRNARLWHPLASDVLRRSTPPTRMQAHVRALAGAVASAGGRRRHDALRRVGWLESAGDPIEPEALTRAARRCVALDAAEAERLARLAIRAGAGLPALIALAQQLMFSGRAEEAAALLGHPPVEVVSMEDQVAVAVMRANNLTFGLGRGEDGARLLDDLRRRQSDDVVDRHLLSQTVPMLLFGGRVDECIERAAHLRDDGAAEPVDRVRARMAYIAALAVTGRPVAAQAEAGAAFAVLGAGFDELPMAAGQIGAGLILALQWAGDLDGADRLAQLGYDAGIRERSDLLRGVSALHLGVGALWRGRVRTASGLLWEAVIALRDNDVGLLGWAVDNARAALALSGAPDKDVVDPTFRHQLYETERFRLGAVAAAARNDSRAAAELARRALEAAMVSGLRTQAVLCGFDLARYGAAQGIGPEPAGVELEGAFLPLLVAATEALRRGEPTALDGVSARFEALGFLLFAAETARAAAAAHTRLAHRAAAAASERRASRLADACEGASTPLLRASPAVATDLLTARERDVSALAAAGATNAEIAERLGLSVRTVETHLQRAYVKLGVHGRSELEPLFS